MASETLLHTRFPDCVIYRFSDVGLNDTVIWHRKTTLSGVLWKDRSTGIIFEPFNY